VFLARHADVVGEEGWPVVAETISSVSSMKDPKKERSSRVSAAERAAVQELVRAARVRGEDITGPDGLLKSITATVLESALEEEMATTSDTPNIGRLRMVRTTSATAPGRRRC
jgi:hypothetical protein